MIFGFKTFGYEGDIVSVKDKFTPLAKNEILIGGIDSNFKNEIAERTYAALKNSGWELNKGKHVITFDCYYNTFNAGLDLPAALSILETDKFIDSVLAYGELELSGKLRKLPGVYAAVSTAYGMGIRYAIVPEEQFEEASAVDGMYIFGARDLNAARMAIVNPEMFTLAKGNKQNNKVKFHENEFFEFNCEEDMLRAIEIAIAGKHNLLAIGGPSSAKEVAIKTLVPLLTPILNKEEAQTPTRIWCLAGLKNPSSGLIEESPFRIPHIAMSIEGMCGGGPVCRPGEISLAHNGTLYLNEMHEFRSSVLQMLRVPLSGKTITLSRAGRSTVYPANFRLFASTSPCPCGNFGSKDKICLCSVKAVEQYWEKIGFPLLDKFSVKITLNGTEQKVTVTKDTIKKMRKHIENAYNIQMKHERFNGNFESYDLSKFAAVDEENQKILDDCIIKFGLSPIRVKELLKVALTISNMDGKEKITGKSLYEAIKYAQSFVYEWSL